MILRFAIVTALVALATEAAELCPNRVASLLKVPGKSDAIFHAQRVEIRQCPFGTQEKLAASDNAGKIQLVAWERNQPKPFLIFDTAESGISQMGTIEGVFALELMGGFASQLVVIQFAEGKPRIALNTASREPFSLQMDRTRLIVTYLDGQGVRRKHEFARSDSGGVEER